MSRGSTEGKPDKSGKPGRMGWTVDRWRFLTGLEQRFGGRADRPRREVVTLRQVHGRRVVSVGDARSDGGEGDALLAGCADVLVGVWTADCVPIHLVAADARIVAAVHSGWRGTAAGVVDAAIEELGRRGVEPSKLEAALGPAIGGCCYEVGEEVREEFHSRYGAAGAAGFVERSASIFLDLRTFLEGRLRALGVSWVGRVGPCTACRTDLLFSYRREGATGRQLSHIGWRA